MGFPQQQCGEADPRVCFSIDHFMEEVFLKSDTSMVVLSACRSPRGQPDVGGGYGRGPASRRGALCRDERVLLQAQALPNVGDLQANLDAMTAAVERVPDRRAGRCSPTSPTSTTGPGNAWRLDDGDPTLPQVGNAFIEQAVELGVPIITAHKGLSTTLGLHVAARVARPTSGPRPRRTPTSRFVAYHSGLRADVIEGPYDDAARERRRRTGSSRACARAASARTRTCTPSSAPRGGR